ncbi:hypothetical protein BGZ63DRAFT_488787 [Mariannaea sp. PMI_226]|nr:hypothetical protein BGZ63DRAFT_488787 [Mariannaea sp. PMI_226]
MATQGNSITVTLGQVAKMIDHSLLHPTMTDADILSGLAIAKKYNVATACVKPYLIALAKKELEGSDVAICPVIGFPHGNSTTKIKVLEAEAAAAEGGKEIDMVINIGKALGGDWGYVADEIDQINNAVVKHGAILKVIFENDYLNEDHIVRLCKICSDVGVGFVKTSTGYGFVKQPNGLYSYQGATVPHLKIMRENSRPEVQVKAAGGVRTLDDLLHVMSLGVTRIGATATAAIMEDAMKRGINDLPKTVQFKPINEEADSTLGAFHHHEVPSPEETDTSAFSASTWAQSQTRVTNARHSRVDATPSLLQRILSQRLNNPGQYHGHQKVFSTVEKELMALLPDFEAAKILVDNYFERIHWFVLVFHQRDFRNKFLDLYQQISEPSSKINRSSSQLGYVALFLAVLVTSLQYTSPDQKQVLVTYGIEAELMKDKILESLKLRTLDLASIGTLEIVQMCVLLGSYYLYHGEPALAWSLCGTGLRIAQTLNLHRRIPVENFQEPTQRQIIEDRRRTWWAVYEIETFSSMLYGFPLSIDDSDCDIEPLNPHDEFSASAPGEQEQDSGQPTLLYFKGSMSRLSTVVKSALIDLYRTRRNREVPAAQDSPARLGLISRVEALNKRLLDWDKSLPEKLRFENFDTSSEPNTRQPSSGQSQPSFEDHLFRLQALSLKLAYENARILVHRPLVSFKQLQSPSLPRTGTSDELDPFQQAMNICRSSALQMSLVGATPGLVKASETYAISFVSLHILTAALTLCISISVDPLSWNAYEARLGIRRLMQIQTSLKGKSIIAAQGLDITKRLMALASASDGYLLNFCENTLMTDAALDYGEVIGNLGASPSLSTEHMSFSNPQDTYIGGVSLGQEQSWIWGWDFSN